MSMIVSLIFIPVVALVLIILNLLFAVHRPDTEKVSPYECGFNPIYGQVRAPFTIQYYLVGILFLVFDIEIAILYPLAVSLNQVSSFGY
jgi:NADH:ubiquinone oxidoreductase subunit 3 (subunit A)